MALTRIRLRSYADPGSALPELSLSIDAPVPAKTHSGQRDAGMMVTTGGTEAGARRSEMAARHDEHGTRTPGWVEGASRRGLMGAAVGWALSAAGLFLPTADDEAEARA